jgi:uncharacterized protein (TIGR02117 family)
MGSSERNVHLVAYDWHTGFVFPAEDIFVLLPDLKARFSTMRYLEFGWGDRRYYQSEGSSLAAKLLAVLLPSSSTMHVVGLTSEPDQDYEADAVVPLLLDDAGYQSLLKFVAGSFYKNRQQQIEEQKAGRFEDSHFYRGVGIYYLFNTCNKWTAKGLKKAGINISPTFKFSAESVMEVVARANQGR